MEDIQNDSEVYLPSKPLDKDHVLMPDLSTYDMLHSMSVQWPFLSFDIIKDQLGDERRSVISHLVSRLIPVSSDNVPRCGYSSRRAQKQRNPNHEIITTPQNSKISRTS